MRQRETELCFKIMHKSYNYLLYMCFNFLLLVFSFRIHKLRKVYHGKEDVVAVDGKSNA